MVHPCRFPSFFFLLFFKFHFYPIPTPLPLPLLHCPPLSLVLCVFQSLWSYYCVYLERSKQTNSIERILSWGVIVLYWILPLPLCNSQLWEWEVATNNGQWSKVTYNSLFPLSFSIFFPEFFYDYSISFFFPSHLHYFIIKQEKRRRIRHTSKHA